MNKWCTINISCLLFLLSSFLFFSCKKTEQIIQTEVEEFTVERHLIIGETMAAQIKRMPKVFNALDSVTYHDAYIYLDKLIGTLKLTAVVKYRDDFKWKITILHDDKVRTAFTLPGGHIYIYTGLLKFLEAEHELMAILGNEIAYADEELAAIALREEYGSLFLGDIILRKEIKKLPEVVEEFPNIEFSKEQVSMADEYAIKLLCPFQYDINGLSEFLHRAHSSNIEWVLSKRGEDMNERLEDIEEYASVCGEEGVTNSDQYKKKIKNFLPK